MISEEELEREDRDEQQDPNGDKGPSHFQHGIVAEFCGNRVRLLVEAHHNNTKQDRHEDRNTRYDRHQDRIVEKDRLVFQRRGCLLQTDRVWRGLTQKFSRQGLGAEPDPNNHPGEARR